MMATEEEQYHIRLIYPPSTSPVYLYEVNKSKERAIEVAINILNHENVPKMHFDDRIIFPSRVKPYRIFSTKKPFIRSSLHLHRNYPDGYEANFGGEDVTYDIFSIAEKYLKSPLTVTKEGIFIRGQQYDAFKLIQNILNDSNKSIFIIDSYIDDNILAMLESKNRGVKVKIITSQRKADAIRIAARSFNRQFRDLEIRSSQDFHDRFVIIDEKEFYHFGHSLKDLGDRGCMFSHIEEPSVIDVLLKEWIRVWGSAQHHV